MKASDPQAVATLRIATISLCGINCLVTPPSRSRAPLLELRLISEDRAVGLRHARDDTRRRTILGWTHVNGHHFASLERGLRPAGAAQDARRAPFAGPLHLAALSIVGNDVQPGVGI